MARKPAASTPKTKQKSNGVTQTFLTPSTPKITPTGSSKSSQKGQPPARKPNASILTFFKKEPAGPELFVSGRSVAVCEVEEEIEEVWEENTIVKRRRTSGSFRDGDCTPPPPVDVEIDDVDKRRKSAPFVEESDSESGDESEHETSNLPETKPAAFAKPIIPFTSIVDDSVEDEIPLSSGDFEGFEGIEDFDDDDVDQGEEFQEKRWAETQRLLELEGEREPNGYDESIIETIRCPLCNLSLAGMSDREASVHVNGCLDGPETVIKQEEDAIEEFTESTHTTILRPPRPGQKDPLTVASTKSLGLSAFSKIMAGHAEDAAWATAAASETASRGKPSYQRTCPFYKIMPGMSICVDAFRYGAVEGCQAYFLSHFHSDHYIGLTATWYHGPIYCSKVTANLVRDQLRVDPKWVVPLEFENEAEVPNTNGVKVTMIPANHCPGSSLFLFERVVGKGKDPKIQRILHCGDFRACKAHLEHPLLMPNIVDEVTKKSKQQRIDICYLDTTYLNSKYAFPCQEDVIKACGDLCVNLNKFAPDDLLADSTVGDTNMKAFLKQSDSQIASGIAAEISPKPGRLLVVVGTYSIGKERVCVGIAKALNSKIYAPPAKQRICAALEDPELSSLLTTNPHEAQVHMTPLFEIRAETLDDYLRDYRSSFTHAIGFRPTGWNYRPPGSRFVESPPVHSILYGANWRSTYTVKDMSPQRGSTRRAACYGVPYSEHSSFRELAAFVCALRIERVIPTVNVGSAKSRERMRMWVDKWMAERRKNGLFKVEHF
jgi:DNA cross-link repair 1A protein